MSPINKLPNQYAEAAGRDFFTNTPKAVWAALAVSFANMAAGKECWGEYLRDFLAKEWATLHANGIVPQKPPKVKP